MQRILVIGGPGAGKSTLASRLAGRLDLPLIHLDREYFGPGWAMPSEGRMAGAGDGARRPPGLGHGRQLRQHLRHPRARGDGHRLARPAALAIAARVLWRVARKLRPGSPDLGPGRLGAVRLVLHALDLVLSDANAAEDRPMLERLRRTSAFTSCAPGPKRSPPRGRTCHPQRGRLTCRPSARPGP